MFLNANVRPSRPTPAPRTLLCHFPTEILLEIIRHVACFAPRELKEIKGKKSKHLIWQQDLGATQSVWTYKQPDHPILNSLQALSAVNARLNELCRPFVWKALHFPSSLPIAMSHWDGLLYKYGDHVKSLTIYLSRDWLGEPWKRAYSVRPRRPIKQRKDPTSMPIPERDNLATREDKNNKYSTHDKHQPLSRENVFRLIAKCPNLTTLHIVLYVHDTSRLMEKKLSPTSASRLQLNLASLLTRLGGIRHLGGSGCWTKLPARCIIEMTKQLPLLESLSCSGISSDSPNDAKDFATVLSGLKHLTRHSFHSTETLDSSMGFWPAVAPKVFDSKIKVCRQLLMSRAPSLISTWTPNLTHFTLHVSCHYPPREFMEDIKAFDPNKHRFKLPELTHLTVWHEPQCDYLRCFQDCKKICHLTYRYIKEVACANFYEFVASTYPQLNTLRLNVLSKSDGEDYYMDHTIKDRENLRRALAPLGDFCQRHGIYLEP
ncbi:hypothetical protein CROQUDRAFT_133480 [Cronartium quercuum f. sp. fusiforme G11]|uniref:Uncharacterized protein n=1 Tax=Cronartium quercuum f. sp. fusiforme G11 TaxID=708437 RepID=A0A9P6NFG4_9BASI|nr:hypothetical protein CROQUDRAFT_133480 [Cronartium quercuum f. sp. fusiforme G11]